MSDPRATRYRRLALVEADPAKARLLFTIADEADRGVLSYIGTALRPPFRR
jgi:hypothetical protein